MTNHTELRALCVAATPGPWHIQYGDDASDMCMTAISTRNKRLNNQGCFTESEFESLVAITLHQSYPWVDPDCKNDDSNSAYIAAMSPDRTLGLLDDIQALTKRVNDAEQREFKTRIEAQTTFDHMKAENERLLSINRDALTSINELADQKNADIERLRGLIKAHVEADSTNSDATFVALMEESK